MTALAAAERGAAAGCARIVDVVRWSNGERRHTALDFVTLDQRHGRQDRAILQQRHQLRQGHLVASGVA